jgi:predicted dehydrogenase
MTLRSLPEPRVLTRGDVPALNWGIVGPGGIAHAFAHALQTHTDQRLVAVGGRSRERSTAFAQKFGIPTVHDSAAALVADEGVDAVYVATLHPYHRDLALLAIRAGKHVLIEKPIAMSAAEAREIAEAAAGAGVLAMEAMWTRFLPQTDILHRLVADGIGDVRFVHADFGFAVPYDPSSRLWAPEMGGGALLDAGVYPISFATSVMGAPDRMSVMGRVGPGGVDTSAQVHLQWTEATGVASTTIEAPLPTRALVIGTRGRVEIDTMFLGPSTLRFTPTGQMTPTLTWRDGRFDTFHDGMSDEILAFASHVGEGLTDSPIHPLATAISVMEIIDEARRQLAAA